MDMEIPPPPSDPGELLADKHLVYLRSKYGDERAVHLARLGVFLGCHLGGKTNSIEEAVDVLNHMLAAINLLNNPINSNTPNDPSSN